MLKRHRERKAGRREHRQQQAAEGLLANVMEAVEFIDDDFDAVDARTEIDQEQSALSVIEKERTRVIEVVTVKWHRVCLKKQGMGHGAKAPNHVTVIFNPVSGQG